MRFVRLLLVSAAFALLSPSGASSLGSLQCDDTAPGPFLCGDDCYLYQPNSNCIYYAYYAECWWDDEWQQTYLCEGFPCYI